MSWLRRRTDRPRLVLHAGTHKTGTTTIQASLQQSRPALRDAGVCYPDPAREPHPHLPAHNFIYRATLNGAAAMAEERARILEEFRASGARTLLLSEEGLCLPRPEIQAFFAPWKAEFEITVVCYLRRQDRFAESLYSQYVRERHALARQEIGAFVDCAEIRERLDYPANLALWKGFGRIVAVNYDALAGGGLAGPVLRAAGLPEDFPLAAVPPANVSPDAPAVEAIRHLDRLELDFSMPHVLTLLRESTPEGAPRRVLMLGSVLRRALLAEMAPVNRRLAREHGVVFSDTLPGEGPESFHCIPDATGETALRALALASLRLRALNRRLQQPAGSG